jgi:hypothetical protein
MHVGPAGVAGSPARPPQVTHAVPWICEASTPTARRSNGPHPTEPFLAHNKAQLDIQALEGAASLVDSGLFLAEQAQVVASA